MHSEGQKPIISRRTALKLSAFGLTLGALNLIDEQTGLSFARVKPAFADNTKKPDIQFDLRKYIGPVVYFDADGREDSSALAGLPFQFGPRHTKIITFKFTNLDSINVKKPNSWIKNATKNQFSKALAKIEKTYEFGPDGIIMVLSYGQTYFDTLERFKPGLLAQYMPRLLSDRNRYALEVAQPSPTDVTSSRRPFDRPRFNVPVKFADYHVTIVFRSDHERYIDDVIAWLRGSGTLGGKKQKSPEKFSQIVEESTFRHFVSEPGWPRRTAEANGLPYASRIHAQSPMWMGFADQHVGASAPPELVTFQGTSKARFTNVTKGHYFFNGCIQHISSNILDLEEFYSEQYVDRVKLMFRSTPVPSQINSATAYGDGVGPAYLDNEFRGTSDAEQNARNGHMGHVAGLQRASRLPDGTPLHIRLDGPGFDELDTERISDPRYTSKKLPKLHFSIFVPTSDLFATMRRQQASPDLVERYGVNNRYNGVEFFTNCTRRQNQLVPPRQHRAFPLMELIATDHDDNDDDD